MVASLRCDVSAGRHAWMPMPLFQSPQQCSAQGCVHTAASHLPCRSVTCPRRQCWQPQSGRLRQGSRCARWAARRQGCSAARGASRLAGSACVCGWAERPTAATRRRRRAKSPWRSAASWGAPHHRACLPTSGTSGRAYRAATPGVADLTCPGGHACMLVRPFVLVSMYDAPC